MRVRVKLFGMLALRVAGYNPDQELEMELPEGAKVEDLLARLDIPKFEKTLVTMDGTVKKAGAELKNDSAIYVFNLPSGG